MILLALLLAVDVAVTVDDLPVHGPDFAGIDRMQIEARILAAFRKHRLPPVYGFVNGSKIPSAPGVRGMWQAFDNPIGNHGLHHLSLNDTSVADYVADIEANEPFITARVFRYPFLMQGDTRDKRDAVRAWLKQHGYKIAHVSIDFDDWAWNASYARCTDRHDWTALGELRRTYLDAAVIGLQRARQLSQLVEGREIKHVLLLHIGAMDAEMMDWLLNSYEAAGARWIPLEEALTDPLYAKDSGVVWKAGATVLDEWVRAMKLPYPKLPWPDEERLEKACR